LLRRLYDWAMGLAAGRHAPAALGAVSFAESSLFPIPPDVMLIPMVLANRKAWWRLALLCTVASVLGALVGYGLVASLHLSLAAYHFTSCSIFKYIITHSTQPSQPKMDD